MKAEAQRRRALVAELRRQVKAHRRVIANFKKQVTAR